MTLSPSSLGQNSRSKFIRPFVAAAVLATTSTVVSTVAFARFVPPVKDFLVAKECGACHMAYPAGLLPAASWSAIVRGLDDHFGENASVDAAVAVKLTAYLTQNAEPAARTGAQAGAVLRITEMDWFKRRHRKNRVAPATLQRKGAMSAAQCQSCHEDAERGDFKD